MPRMIAWRDRTYWSIPHDHEMCRISGFDEHHKEFYILIDADGPGFRKRRDAAVILIQEAIEAVDVDGRPLNEPGEVK